MTHNKSIRQEVIELETYKSNYIQKNYVEGKVIIITGASSGFGKLTAKRAAEMGGKIVLAARSEEKLKETVAEIKAAGGEASYIVTDVAKKDDVFAMAKFAVDTYGRIDVLVNNAGTMPLAFFSEHRSGEAAAKAQDRRRNSVGHKAFHIVFVVFHEYILLSSDSGTKPCDSWFLLRAQ